MRAFTLIELLVVIAIMAILSALLLPALACAKRKARMIEEMSSAKQLILGVQLYADDHNNAVFPGYVADPTARDDQGQPVGFPQNARYPWRIAPYLSYSFETIYCSDNRAKLNQLRGLDHASYVYSISLFPSLGMNSFFAGGNETEFPADIANAKFGDGTVLTRVDQARSPSKLMMFVSARSTVSGTSANGYFQVTPPYLTTRKWAADWTASLPPNQWGFVAPRYSKRAVTAMLDGHAQTLGLNELQDMRYWCNNADRPDFLLQPK